MRLLCALLLGGDPFEKRARPSLPIQSIPSHQYRTDQELIRTLSRTHEGFLNSFETLQSPLLITSPLLFGESSSASRNRLTKASPLSLSTHRRRGRLRTDVSSSFASHRRSFCLLSCHLFLISPFSLVRGAARLAQRPRAPWAAHAAYVNRSCFGPLSFL